MGDPAHAEVARPLQSDGPLPSKSKEEIQLLTADSLSSLTGELLDGVFFAWHATVVALDVPDTALVQQHSRGDS